MYGVFFLLILTSTTLAYTGSRKNLQRFEVVFNYSAFKLSPFYLLHLLFAAGMLFGSQALQGALTSVPFLVVYLVSIWLIMERLITRAKIHVKPEARTWIWASIGVCLAMNLITLIVYHRP